MKCLLILLILINFINYIDRGVLSSYNINMIEQFNITNTQAGLISSSFMIGYLIFSPIFSYLIYKFNRIILIFIGLMVWCISTFLSGFANTYLTMIFSRLFVGVGEAAFSAISPPIIDSVAPKNYNSRWFSLYYLTIPVGFALGFIFGGIIQTYIDWHYGFIIESGIMFMLSIALLYYKNIDKKLKTIKKFLEEPYNSIEFNIFDMYKNEKISSITFCKKCKTIFCNKIFIFSLLVYIFYTFVIGCYSFWGPAFIIQNYNITELTSDTIFGGITISTGLIGTFIGGLLLDLYKHKYGRLLTASFILVISLLVGTSFFISMFCFKNLIGFIILLTIGQLLMFSITGPINSLFIWTVENKDYSDSLNNQLKSLACAISTMFIHLFGDVPSPILTGFIYDHLQNWNLTMLIITSILGLSIIFSIINFFIIKKEIKINKEPLLEL